MLCLNSVDDSDALPEFNDNQKEILSTFEKLRRYRFKGYIDSPDANIKGVMRSNDDSDPYEIANYPPDIAWMEDNERKYKSLKESINYDLRLYIDVPFDADEKFRKSCKQLNDLRPLNSFDRVTKQKRQEIQDIQGECLFLWIRYYCIKIVGRKTAIPGFLPLEPYFKDHFGPILDEYSNTSIHADDRVFKEFIHRLESICSCIIKSNDQVISTRNMNKNRLMLLVSGAIRKFQIETTIMIPSDIIVLISNIMIEITLLPVSLELLNFIIGGSQVSDNLSIKCDYCANGASSFLAELIKQHDHRVLEFCANITEYSKNMNMTLSSLPRVNWRCLTCGEQNNKTYVICGGCFLDKEVAMNDGSSGKINHKRLHRFFKGNLSILPNLRQLLSKINE